MSGAHAQRVRCAIYTRKSSEEGLEQAFNSLDAQREACAAYIVSQRHEGWLPVRDVYDDGGYSGGTLERPGLKRLLAEVEAGRVDVIVVYKVDRLTRSLSDFARIVDVLDARGASFVSITQSFNTTTSMGRLTLNVLLSFAQFEREVTGERIRDKIAQSKAKGMWMGGPVPLGYAVQDRKLLIDENEAATVRHIFARYVALGSGQLLIDELRVQGYRTKVRPQTGGAARGGVPFGRGALFHLLGNRVYLGEIVHKGVSHPGEHPALIDQLLWDQVQATIERNRAEPQRGHRTTERSLLTGILRDGEGRRMSPTHAVNGTKRYRYYVTHASELIANAPLAWRVPAHDLETIVVARLKDMLTDRREIRRLVDAGDGSASALHLAITSGTMLAAQLDAPDKRRELVAAVVTGVQMTEADVTISVSRAALLPLLRIEAATFTDDDAPDAMLLTAPATRTRVGKEVRLLVPADDEVNDRDTRLLALLAEAMDVREMLLANPEQSIDQIARETGRCRSRTARLLRLAFVAPDVVERVIAGEDAAMLTSKGMSTTLPACWRAQTQLLLTH